MSLCQLNYFSDALGKQTAAYVLLPEVGKPPYPVLYLLHGLSDDYTMWLRRSAIERYVSNLPLIVVMPDGGRGYYSDAAEGFPYKKVISQELVARIDRTFPTLAAREGRFLAGLSMGGYGALKIALTYPEMFCAAVSHSGAVAFGHQTYGWDGKPYPPEFQRVLGDNHVGGPDDLFAVAAQSDPATRPALRLDCGTEDFLLENNRAFHAHLTACNIPHEYAEFPGGHTWDYWDTHVQDTLVFLAEQQAAGIVRRE